jgi:hypothetical protein
VTQGNLVITDFVYFGLALIASLVLFVLSWLTGVAAFGVLASIFLIPFAVFVVGALIWQLFNF